MKSTVGSYGIINGVEIEYIDKLPDDVTINGNNEKFQQVLMNMIKNAIEASSRGQNVEVKCFKKGEEVKIRISDAGSGIKEDHLKLLGTPFYSTKEEGTGLGLSVSYKIVEAMGGSIMVESRENEGTAFTISLPIASEK
ncbi:MAG: HAMP domain-containing histidine kinase [Bacillus sp. (in: Bacteria)]|nr:HAMP domain-containing histidine kinase [Bacillus sp. (in: firmicutes)]